MVGSKEDSIGNFGTVEFPRLNAIDQNRSGGPVLEEVMTC